MDPPGSHQTVRCWPLTSVLSNFVLARKHQETRLPPKMEQRELAKRCSCCPWQRKPVRKKSAAVPLGPKHCSLSWQVNAGNFSIFFVDHDVVHNFLLSSHLAYTDFLKTNIFRPLVASEFSEQH